MCGGMWDQGSKGWDLESQTWDQGSPWDRDQQYFEGPGKGLAFENKDQKFGKFGYMGYLVMILGFRSVKNLQIISTAGRVIQTTFSCN